jgi:hypothetical protein
MSESELGRALLKLDAAGLASALDPRQQTAAVLSRDRRRVRRLAVLTVLLWLLAGAALGLMIWFHFLFIVPKLDAYVRNLNWRDGMAWVLISKWAAGVILAFVAAMLLAALCTVLLVFSSRRATLRQVNANLLEISEQLRQLRAALASRPPG